MPYPPGSSNLTGTTRYRTSFMGKMILQVEERHIAHYEGRLQPGVERQPVYGTSWRDATAKDMSTLEWMARSAPTPPSGGSAGQRR